MNRSLIFKLVLAFLLVSITGAALTTLFARWTTFREFDQLVLEQVRNDFMADVTTYYEVHGSWEEAWEFFRRSGAGPLPLPQRGQELPPMLPIDQASRQLSRSSYVFALAVADGPGLDGCVVLPAGPYRLGERVPAEELAQGEMQPEVPVRSRDELGELVASFNQMSAGHCP